MFICKNDEYKNPGTGECVKCSSLLRECGSECPKHICSNFTDTPDILHHSALTDDQPTVPRDIWNYLAPVLVALTLILVVACLLLYIYRKKIHRFIVKPKTETAYVNGVEIPQISLHTHVQPEQPDMGQFAPNALTPLVPAINRTSVPAQETTVLNT